jgi:hypothetical protein
MDSICFVFAQFGRFLYTAWFLVGLPLFVLWLHDRFGVPSFSNWPGKCWFSTTTGRDRHRILSVPFAGQRLKQVMRF